MAHTTFKVTSDLSGSRLDVAVASILKISRSAALKLIRSGLVKIDDNIGRSSTIVQLGNAISIANQSTQSAIMPPPDLKVLYEDKDLIVVDKPAGLAVHESETGLIQPTVSGYAQARGVEDDDTIRPGIVHRLDKDTSGLMVIARNIKSKSYMQKLFAERKVTKIYWALVLGRLKQDEATISLPVDRSRKQPVKRAVVPGGRGAITHYRVLETLPGASLVEITLETGRTHQIRVHFSHIGHPVAGDKLYGGGKGAPHLGRQFLHAKMISFIGPSSQKVHVESNLSSDLMSYLEALRNKL